MFKLFKNIEGGVKIIGTGQNNTETDLKRRQMVSNKKNCIITIKNY